MTYWIKIKDCLQHILEDLLAKKTSDFFVKLMILLRIFLRHFQDENGG